MWKLRKNQRKNTPTRSGRLHPSLGQLHPSLTWTRWKNTASPVALAQVRLKLRSYGSIAYLSETGFWKHITNCIIVIYPACCLIIHAIHTCTFSRHSNPSELQTGNVKYFIHTPADKRFLWFSLLCHICWALFSLAPSVSVSLLRSVFSVSPESSFFPSLFPMSLSWLYDCNRPTQLPWWQVECILARSANLTAHLMT